jgi:CDP-glucose 4,6-dehydratase
VVTPHPVDLESLRAAYGGKRVLVTGHTGFKGSWLALWLRELGAEVTGLALDPDTSPSLFDVAGVASACRDLRGDIRERDVVRGAVRESRPDVVLHLAAQALVRKSYVEPVETLATNVMGTAHLLDALRAEGRPCAVVIVTSDKCYENREWVWGYREDEPMGGHDVYSMSKGAAELVVSSWRRSFFPPAKLTEHGVAIASARAGNVVGGGDWSDARIVPDCVRALARREPIAVRNPASVRPWQHVLEPLGAYLLLGARLAGHGTQRPQDFCEPWNFGPTHDSTRTVREVVEALIASWGEGAWDDRRDPNAPHEATLLRLSIEKAASRLAWSPRWGFEETFARTAHWYRAFYGGATGPEMRALCVAQIRAYCGE